MLGLPVLAALLVTGCNSPNLENEDELAVFKKNEEFGNKMADAVKGLHPKGRVLLASFVSANNMQETDGFGRITSEQVAGCLVQHGLRVVETRLRHDGTDPEFAVSEDPAGEFALTRDVKRLAAEQDADIVMFLFREEYYDKETENKGTAEVIIGKNRNGPLDNVRLTFAGEYLKFSNYVSQERYGQ